MDRAEKFALGTVLFSIAISALSIPYLPHKIRIFFGGYGGENIDSIYGVFILPFVCASAASLVFMRPKLQKGHIDVEHYYRYYENITLLAVLFFAFFNIMLILWNYGTLATIIPYISVAFAAILFYAGAAVTDWKLHIQGETHPHSFSRRIWNQMHKFAGDLLKLAAFSCAAGVIFPDTFAIIIIVPALLAFFTFIYSAAIFNAENEQRKKKPDRIRYKF